MKAIDTDNILNNVNMVMPINFQIVEAEVLHEACGMWTDLQEGHVTLMSII